MKTIKMNIAELKHPEKNIRKHPQKQITEMKRSIEKFGQFRPVVIDETNTILAGNGLVIAMRELGKQEVDVLQYSNLSANDKKKLMIADIQVAALGVDVYGAIEEILLSLGDDLDVPGYDDETLRMITAESDAVVNTVQNYGIYPQEEVESLRAVEADREEHGVKAVEQTYNAGGFTPPPVNHSAESVAEEAEETKAYSKVNQGDRYVTCPDCGKKIYI